MQSKSKLAVLSLVGAVGLVSSLVVLILVPTSDPMKVTLQSYTNACAVIAIKNQSSACFNYIAMVERKIGGNWPKGLAPGTSIPDHQFGSLGPGQQANLTVPVLVYAPSYPWRISVFGSRPRPLVQVNSVRFRAGLWCAVHGLRNVSHKLLGGGFKQVQVSTPEMEQWEK
jgi:hypothetical protein